jgi:hypothetical protein
MRAELEAHMDEAETGVFPAVRARAGFGAATAGELVQEHDATGAALARMRGLTGGYDLALALCNAHSATLDGLRSSKPRCTGTYTRRTTSSPRARPARSYSAGAAVLPLPVRIPAGS